MKKLILLLALAPLACARPDAAPPTGPLPVEHCEARGNAEICAAFDAFDVALSLIDLYRSFRPGFDGTPDARRLADLIEKVRDGLNAASEIQRGLRDGDYGAALRGALDGLAELKIFAAGLR